MSQFVDRTFNESNWSAPGTLRSSSQPQPSLAQLFESLHSEQGVDCAVLNSLIEHYLPLVTYQARKLSNRLPSQVDPEDLVQSGSFGLRDAILAFDPERGIRFETYCAPRVVGSMLDSLREMDWVPRLVRRDEAIFKRASETLRIELNRDPTEDELMDHFLMVHPEQLSVGVIEQIRGQHLRAHETVSLDSILGSTDSDRDVFLATKVANDRAPDPTAHAMNEDLRRALLKGFNKAQRLIYILYVVEELPMKVVGEHLDLSESRVSQMFSEMIEIWQHRIDEAALNGSATELGLIAEIFDRSKKREGLDISEGVIISQEVISRLDEMNALSAVSFTWNGKGEEYESSLESDPAINSLIERMVQQRHAAPLDNSPLNVPAVLPVRPVIPEIEDRKAKTPTFAFVFQDGGDGRDAD